MRPGPLDRGASGQGLRPVQLCSAARFTQARMSTQLKPSGPRRRKSARLPEAPPKNATSTPTSAPPFELLESKLLPPRGHGGAVLREEVISALEGSRGTPVVCVSAGPGWGKTTLLAQWATQSQRPFAWVSVDDHDNDPIVLLTYVATALDRVSPLDPGVFDALASPGVSVDATVVPRLGAALTEVSEPVVVVLDDLHLLDSRGVPRRHRSTHATRRERLADGPLGARRTGASARGIPGAGLGTRDRAGRPPHGRGGGGPAPERRRAGPAGRPRRRAHRPDGGLVRRPLPCRAVAPCPRAQGQGRNGVFRERPVRGRIPAVGAARTPLPRRSSLPQAHRRAGAA